LEKGIKKSENQAVDMTTTTKKSNKKGGAKNFRGNRKEKNPDDEKRQAEEELQEAKRREEAARRAKEEQERTKLKPKDYSSADREAYAELVKKVTEVFTQINLRQVNLAASENQS